MASTEQPQQAFAGKAKNVCATIWDLDFAATLETWGPDSLNLCKYLCWDNEICPDTGRLHLQCYFNFAKDMRLTALKKLHPTCHWKVCRGTAEQNKTYCSKDFTLGVEGCVFHEIGNFEDVCGAKHSGGNGARLDLEAFKDDVKAGMISLRDLREKHTLVFAKYPRYVREHVQDHQPTVQIEAHMLRSWQEHLNQILINEPNKRKIIFVVDPKGNSGKTWFAQHYCHLHPLNSQLLKSGKYPDMAYAFEQQNRHLFTNCSKSHSEFLSYDFLESVKDKHIWSTKYESMVNTCGFAITSARLVMLPGN
jgi:hypothetical protein